jgi:hypothetical protein
MARSQAVCEPPKSQSGPAVGQLTCHSLDQLPTLSHPLQPSHLREATQFLSASISPSVKWHDKAGSLGCHAVPGAVSVEQWLGAQATHHAIQPCHSQIKTQEICTGMSTVASFLTEKTWKHLKYPFQTVTFPDHGLPLSNKAGHTSSS